MKLRMLEAKDAPFILEWMKDPSVNCFFRFDPEKITEQSVTEFIQSAQDSAVDLHLACVNDNDEYLGTVSLKHMDKSASTAEYAISFRQSAQGTGAARYATSEIIKMAFESLGLNRIYLNVLADNVHAIRFYEKLGFQYEGTFKKHLCIRGKYKDLKWFAILKEDYDGCHEKG